MSEMTFEEKVQEFKTQSDEQLSLLAEVYSDILQKIQPALVDAKLLVSQWSPSIKGVKELSQLATIAEGSFGRIANEIVMERDAKLSGGTTSDPDPAQTPTPES